MVIPVKAQTIAQAAVEQAEAKFPWKSWSSNHRAHWSDGFEAGAAFVLDALRAAAPCGDSACWGSPESQATFAAHEIGWRKSGHPYIRPRWLTALIASLQETKEDHKV